MRELCFKCLRPVQSCYCRFVKKIDTDVKFVFLMHPKEAKRQRTGTGRLASLCLPESEIIVGIDFTKNERLNSLINDDKYFPVLMYPDENAWTASKEGFTDAVKVKTLLVIIIDSTWFCSKKMINLSQNIKTLPRISFSKNYRSIFTFKREPHEYCISTIESVYYFIEELKEASVCSKDTDTSALMDVFKHMIKFQLEKENERIRLGLPGNHAYDIHYNKIKEIPDEILN